jgi:hypothetical protein
MTTQRAFKGSVCACAVVAALAGARPALAINLTVQFTNNWMNIQNAQTRAQAQAVVNQAAANWAAAITDNFNLTVTVDWNVPFAYGNQDSSVCGVGGVDTTQFVGGVEKPATGRIILNSNLLGNGGAGTWFIDPTPATSEEYQAVPGEPWRGRAVAPAAVNHIDMLSCAKHEFGHTLGFMYDVANARFNPYINEVNANGGIMLNDFNNIVLPVPGAGGVNAQSHFLPVGNVPGTGIPMADLLMVPDAPQQGDDRTVMSPYDVSAVAKILGLPAGGAYNLYPKDVIPAPGSAAVVLGLGVLVGRRRR